MTKIPPIFSGTCKDFVGITLEICDIFCRCCPWLSVSVAASILLGQISGRCVKQQLPYHFRICLESWNIWLCHVHPPSTYSSISPPSRASYRPIMRLLSACYIMLATFQWPTAHSARIPISPRPFSFPISYYRNNGKFSRWTGKGWYRSLFGKTSRWP